MSTFGERLRAARIAAGLSQSALAAGELSPSYVSLLESDKRSPSTEIVHQLAARLGCPVSDLLDGEPSERDTRVELELAFARLAVAHGEADQARDRLRRLLSEDGLAPRVQDEIRLQLSIACDQAGDLVEAIRQATPLFERACRPDGPRPTHVVVTAIGMYLVGYHLDSGDLHRAIDVGERALTCARQQDLDTTTQYFRLAATVMWAYVERGDWTHAALWADDLIEEATRQGTPAGQAAVYWNAAELAERQGRLAQALGLAERALGHLSEQNNTRDYARLRLTMAFILLSVDPPVVDRAADLLDRCAEDLQNLGSPVDRADWHVVHSLVDLHRGDGLAAEVQARQAVDLLGRSTAPRYKAVALMALHDALAAQGRDSGDVLEQAFRALGEAPLTRLTAVDWRALAERLVGSDPALAVRAFRRALDGGGVLDRTAVLREQVRLLRERPPVPVER